MHNASAVIIQSINVTHKTKIFKHIEDILFAIFIPGQLNVRPGFSNKHNKVILGITITIRT